MAQKNVNQEEVVVAEVVSKTEKFFEENGKAVIIALVVLVAVVAGGWFYKYFAIDKNQEAASELIIAAQDRFAGETPDYALALNGDETGAGFLDVIEQYGSTDAGNIACHYAGICYLRLGDLENAAKYLAKFDAPCRASLPEQVIVAQNLGLQGDVAVELGNYAEAAALFAKAVKASENSYTAPYYLVKEARALAAAGELEKAQECYKTIVANYPNSTESREAEKQLR